MIVWNIIEGVGFLARSILFLILATIYVGGINWFLFVYLRGVLS